MSEHTIVILLLVAALVLAIFCLSRGWYWPVVIVAGLAAFTGWAYR